MNFLNPDDLTHLVWWVWAGVCKLDLDGKEHLGLFVIFLLALFMECIKSLECTQFVFPVSISVLPGIFCDRFDG